MNRLDCRFTFYLLLIGAPLWAASAIADDVAPVNSSFEQGQPGQVPDGWHIPAIEGYQVLLSDENPKSGKQSVLIQRNADVADPFGNVMQGIDAAPFRGQRVRYRAAVRTEVKDDEGRAHLWLRVDLPREKGQPRVGFFDNMFNRPISDKDWTYYEIVGDIADDAEKINIGMYFMGRGRAWLDDVSLEIVGQDAQVTGRDLTGMHGTSLEDIGAGLFEISGGTELNLQPSWAKRLVEAIGIAGDDAEQREETVDLLLPMPLAYRDQAPVTYELTVTPPEAAKSITVYQDTPYNHVAKVSVALSDEDQKVSVAFRSLVLVGPSAFDGVPDEAEFPEQWPEECQPWLESTWCVDSQDERIQALSKEITDDASDVLTLIAGVKERSAQAFYNAHGQAKDLTAPEALEGRGSCTSCANLVAALLRASNVPARILSGYPSWSGPLQTHYIVEAYVPGYGWYPIESTLSKSPWPNANQVNVAVIPPEYEEQELANWRNSAAGGVPYLSLTEMPGVSTNIEALGTIDRERNCDHQCRLVRKFAESNDWQPALDVAKSRWQSWLAAASTSSAQGRLEFGLEADSIHATSPSELILELTR